MSTPIPDAPGCLVLHHSPLAVAGGDAFVHSNFDGCIESALSIVIARPSPESLPRVIENKCHQEH